MVITPASPRKFNVLLRLAAEPGRRISRTTLAELVFSEQEPANAAHSLRELIYQLKKSGIRIQSDRAGVWLDPSDALVDFEQIILQASPLSNEQLKTVAGGFLPAFDVDTSDLFSEWLSTLRVKTIIALSRRTVGEATNAKRRGDWERVELAARACLALDPLNEEAVLVLAEMLALAGAKAQAVVLLDDYLEEIGIANPDLRVQAKVLRRRVSERFEGVPRAERRSAFLGRDLEMLALRDAFDRAKSGTANAVVVWGDAGIGKSRLVAEFSELARLEGAQVV